MMLADKIGYFQFVDETQDIIQLQFQKPGFEHKIIEFDVYANEKKKIWFYFLAPFLDIQI